MITYYIKQEFISNRYLIFSDNEETCLKSQSNYLLSTIDRTVGSLLSIGHKIYIRNMNDIEVLTIKKKFGVLSEKYDIYLNSFKRAEVKQHMKSLKPKITVNTNDDEYVVKGDLFAKEFNIYKNGTMVAEMNKVIFSFKDSYKVDIFEGEENLIIAIAIVIDSSVHN